MKNLTLKWLEKQSACSQAVKVFADQKERDCVKLMGLLIKGGKLDWASWLIARLLKKKDRIRYAIFAAEQVLDIYEKKYPDDQRPRKAIEAAKAVLKKDNKVNRNAAADAVNAAADAAYAAYADAAYADAAYADAADEMKIKILNYGINLLKGKR